MALIVVISGKAGAGKDTLANMIEARLRDHSILRLAFASPIKEMISVILEKLGITPEWDNRRWKETVITQLGVSPRDMCLSLGTAWGQRMVTKALWVKCMIGDVVHNTFDDDIVIVTDLRFPHELEGLRTLTTTVEGFDLFTVEIIRPQHTRIDHISEAGIGQPCDCVIHNSDTLEVLEKQADALAVTIIEKLKG